jgi:hypothetical protein
MSRDLEAFAGYFRPGFLPWLERNDAIWQQFQQQTLVLIAAGWRHFSSRTIVEEIRHYTRLREQGRCSFKINGNFAPDLARVFAIRHPAYAKFWEYRRPDWREFIAAIETKEQPA